MRYIAFLRAINVGGHTVRMETLRQLFEALGFSGVETFIASGNVLFETSAQNPKSIEKQIGLKLHEALGFEVAAFLRTGTQVNAIASYKPFKQSALDGSAAFNVAFLADPLEAAARKKLLTLRTDIDDFHAHEREIYWLCLNRQSESTFSNAVLERTLRRPATLRGMRTVKKIAEKYFSGDRR